AVCRSAEVAATPRKTINAKTPPRFPAYDLCARGMRLTAGARLPIPMCSAEAPVFVGAGAVAEWLCRGLQSLVHRFDSGPRLHAGWVPRFGLAGRAVVCYKAGPVAAPRGTRGASLRSAVAQW